MAKKKQGNGQGVKSQQQQLADVVTEKGSEGIVAKELKCSQQSVSAWIRGTWLPRPAVQQRIHQRYGIPMPWKLPEGGVAP